MQGKVTMHVTHLKLVYLLNSTGLTVTRHTITEITSYLLKRAC